MAVPINLEGPFCGCPKKESYYLGVMLRPVIFQNSHLRVEGQDAHEAHVSSLRGNWRGQQLRPITLRKTDMEPEKGLFKD